MMKKIDYKKINNSNRDIWAILYKAIETSNISLIQLNIGRLYKLQKYYIDLLFYQQVENEQLKDLYEYQSKMLNEYEKEFLIEASKKAGIYERIQKRIDKEF